MSSIKAFFPSSKEKEKEETGLLVASAMTNNTTTAAAANSSSNENANSNSSNENENANNTIEAALSKRSSETETTSIDRPTNTYNISTSSSTTEPPVQALIITTTTTASSKPPPPPPPLVSCRCVVYFESVSDWDADAWYSATVIRVQKVVGQQKWKICMRYDDNSSNEHAPILWPDEAHRL